MENKSIWTKFHQEHNLKQVDKDITLDIAIIGGGITGISISYFLAHSNLNVGLFEKSTIGNGITSKTTGKITFLQQGLITKIKNIYDKKVAEEYYHSQKEAISLITKIINDNNINCDLKEVNSYYFATKENDIKKIKEEKKLLEAFNEEVREINEIPDGLRIKYGIMCKNTYVFNPIKYLNSLTNIIKNKISIYENSKVTKIEKDENHYVLSINNYKVKAKKVVVASHYPYFLFPYLFPLKCSLEKSYIGAYLDTSKKNFSAINHSSPIISIRFVEGEFERYKLILTNSHNICLCENDEKNYEVLKKGNPSYLWSNTDVMTKDYMPYIGLVDKNLYIATGYNTWGMTNGTLAGKIISDLLLNKENSYITLFNPKRHNNIKTIIKYPLYALSSVYAILNTKLVKNKNWYDEKVRFTHINGVSVAIYKDEENKEHIVKNKCPHLGCSLIFNETELTWDCPCHASRFDLDGHVIEGPSNFDITFK